MIYEVMILILGVYLGQEYTSLPSVKSIFVQLLYKVDTGNEQTNKQPAAWDSGTIFKQVLSFLDSLGSPKKD